MKKEEGNEPEDEDNKKKQEAGEEASEEPDRLAAIEDKVDKLAGLVNSVMGGKNAAKKQGGEAAEDPTNVDSETSEEGNDNMGKKKVKKKKKKMPEEEEDEDLEKEEDEEEEGEKKKKKKMPEEENDDEDMEKEEGEPKPREGEVKLPKSPAGETDEDTPKETDEIPMTQKKLNGLVTKAVQNVIEKGLKSGDIVKTTTPRPITKNIEMKPKEEVDLANQIIEKTKSGEWDAGKINMMIKKGLKKQKDTMMQKFRDEFLADGGED